MGRHWRAGLATWLLLVLDVYGAGAQTNSAIAGTAKDGTGGVLPGVAVEVTSPALIEKVRSAVTDATGQYRIIELRPGVYSVTFTLPGFNTVRHEGIELTTSFSATVNAELRVGDIAETITVSGDSPIVDTQNTLKQRVITRDVMDAIPSAKNFAALGILIPGATVFNNVAVGRSNDVGGSAGNSDQTLSIHGGRGGDQRILVDGMSTNLQEGLGGQTHFVFPHANIEEMAVQIGAHSAEAETGGMMFNIIPKSGGNQFKGYAYASFTNKSLLSNNLSDDLKARGLLIADQIDYISDLNPSIGGPILRDRLWFYAGVRSWRVMRLTSIFYDTDPSDWVYTPDVTRGPVPYATPTWDVTGRLTWQASLKNKFSFNLGKAARCECEKTLGGTVVYEASSRTQFPARLFQATWVAPATNRILFEAGVSGALSDSDDRPQPEHVAPAATELSSSINFRAATIQNRSSRWRNYTVRASTSYVTGSHNFKAGVIFNPATTRRDVSNVSDYEVQLLNGVPNRVNYLATPYYDLVNQNKFALFGQDQWTIKRLTLNGGLRFDWLRTSYPDVDLVATRWLPARHFPGADVLNWKDLQPRLGAAYDLFGTGKTALKVTLSRYAIGDNVGTTRGISPSNASGGTLLRAWVDSNRDFVPQGDPLNPLPNGELVGPSTNLNFGKPVLTLRLDPAWANGWGVRDYNWETSASIQQQLFSRVSANAGYFRRWYGNFSVIDNLAVSPGDYDPFCITAPRDGRLPGGGGQQICGLFDISPSKVGANDRMQTRASNYGKQTEVWQGVDLTLDARLTNGVLLQGGLSAGKTVSDNCDVVTKVDNPSPLFCRSEQPLLTQIKLVGSYTLPAQIQIAATLQSASGIIASGVAGGADYGIQANYIATNAVIAPVLKRDLSSGPNGSVSVNLVQPGTMALDRVNQLDLRLARPFNLGHTKIKGMVDFYNVLNGNPVVRLNYTYGTTGATWLTPQNILLGRLVTFAAQVDF